MQSSDVSCAEDTIVSFVILDSCTFSASSSIIETSAVEASSHLDTTAATCSVLCRFSNSFLEAPAILTNTTLITICSIVNPAERVRNHSIFVGYSICRTFCDLRNRDISRKK